MMARRGRVARRASTSRRSRSSSRCSRQDLAVERVVVRRDLGPSNILVDRSGGVKLIDFCLAKLLEDDNEQDRNHLRLMTPGSAARSRIRRAVTPATTSTRLTAALQLPHRARARPRCTD